MHRYKALKTKFVFPKEKAVLAKQQKNGLKVLGKFKWIFHLIIVSFICNHDLIGISVVDEWSAQMRKSWDFSFVTLKYSY